jgi:FkbM family methyltransferase
MKRLLRKILSTCGLRITRVGLGNRFQAMDEVLLLLRARGYSPRLVVDAGANMGQWSGMASKIFSSARFHMIEPQSACLEQLQRMASSNSRFVVHPVAVSEPAVEQVAMFGVDNRGSTGAYVGKACDSLREATFTSARTLDTLVANAATVTDRLLLKLDLEGHELSALRGAERLLQVTEVIILEAHIYDPDKLGRATFDQLFDYLSERDFILYDVASLSSRQRDGRLRQGDFVFVRASGELLTDDSWA